MIYKHLHSLGDVISPHLSSLSTSHQKGKLIARTSPRIRAVVIFRLHF